MKLSTKARYGARAMLELALHYGKGPVLLRDIAKRQEISEKYLVHLITALKAARLVNSVRGARGGYVLAKPPSQIRLSEVVRALEGSIAPVECVDSAKICHRAPLCVTRDIWKEMKEAMMSILESMTLDRMVNLQREKEKLGMEMYYI